MHRYAPRDIALAASLAALAGFVDAIGFVTLGGYFVSFMSGNSTRLGVDLAEGRASAGLAGGLIALFVAGVVAGSLVGHAARARRRPAVLVLVAALLGFAAACGTTGALAPAIMVPAPAIAAIVAIVLAMGAENAVFERDGEVGIGLTYMTGALVKLGQRLAVALLGGDRWGWTPYALLWLGLVVGAIAGAAAHASIGLNALWIAAGAAALGAFAQKGCNSRTSAPPL